MSDFFEFFWAILLVVVAIIIVVFTCCLPFAYFNGKANAIIFKKNGIEMPWYYAASFKINFQEHDGKLNLSIVKGE